MKLSFKINIFNYNQKYLFLNQNNPVQEINFINYFSDPKNKENPNLIIKLN